MRKSRAYKRTSVKQVVFLDLQKSIGELGGSSGVDVVVGLDVGKDEIVACLRWNGERIERPWSVKNPTDIHLFVDLLQELKPCVRSLRVGLESTGTYGEVVRRKLTVAGIDVLRVSGKATSDYKEIYDGVPSQHDGKDAAVIAELVAFGKGVAWPFVEATAAEQQMKCLVLQMDAYQVQKAQWVGRLEGLLAAHWPELGRLLELGSVTALSLLRQFGSPVAVAAATDARQQLRSWGGTMLKSEKIELVLESARHTCGVPVGEAGRKLIMKVAAEGLSALREIQACERELSDLVEADKRLSGYVKAIGAGTLAVLVTAVGDPREYGSSGAFLKALGLNLKEQSSGRRQIYMWALRSLQRDELKAWYQAFTKVGSGTSRHGSGEHRKMKGIVALMRKQCRGLWHAMKHAEEFDYEKLFSKPGETSPSRRRRLRRRRLAKAKRQAEMAGASANAEE
jgi:transposase